MGQNKYDVAYKRESVQMMESGISAPDVSEKLGVHVKTLYRWRDEYRRDGEDAFPGKGNLCQRQCKIVDLWQLNFVGFRHR